MTVLPGMSRNDSFDSYWQFWQFWETHRRRASFKAGPGKNGAGRGGTAGKTGRGGTAEKERREEETERRVISLPPRAVFLIKTVKNVKTVIPAAVPGREEETKRRVISRTSGSRPKLLEASLPVWHPIFISDDEDELGS